MPEMLGHSRFRGRQRGFSLIELVVVIVIVLIVSAFAVVQIGSIQRNLRVETAYQNVVMQLRRARQEAIDRRRVHRVAFTLPRTIVITRQNSATEVAGGAPPTVDISRLDLPSDIEFRIEPGAPTGASGPDGLGGGTNPIDFSTDNIIYFQPDGSSLDGTGRIRSGVFYFARPTELGSSRAVTLMGATGRIKGWRLEKQGGTWVWK